MRTKTVLLIGLAVLGATLALLLATREWGVGTRPWLDGTTRVTWQYLLEDTHDRSVYQQRGRWLPAGVEPYLGEHSEYPEIATWQMGLPYLLFDHHVPEGGYDQTRDARGKRRVTPAEREHLTQDRDAYFDGVHVLLAVWYAALFALTVVGLRRLGASPAWALLLLLPGGLYFGFNRFDTMPAVLAAMALLARMRGRTLLAAALLGVGMMTKWYPILLLPMFCSWDVHERRAAGAAWGAALMRGLVVPGLVAGAAVMAISSVTFLWNGGGLDAVRYAFDFHGRRGANQSSIVAALTTPGRWEVFAPTERQDVARWFTAAQFAPAALLALLPVRSRNALLLGCLTVVIGFVTFSKVFSPQWVLWIAPIGILLCPRRPVLAGLLSAALVLVYLQLPVMHYRGPVEVDGQPVLMQPLEAFWTVNDIRIAVFVALWLWSLVAFLRAVAAGPRADEAGPVGPAGTPTG